MNAQDIMEAARLTRVRELQTQLTKAAQENARLAKENSELNAHLDLAILAATELNSLSPEAKFIIVDGWNKVLGADRSAKTPEELIADWQQYLINNPADFVWIVFDGNRENSRLDGRLRISYTGGSGLHRADKFICDFLRMAKFRAKLEQIIVETDDKDFKREVARLKKW